MSDTATTDSSAPEASGPKELREALSRREEQVKTLEAQLSALTESARAREFDDAGVPAEGWGQAFRKSYEGDLTQEAIRGQVEAWGIPVPSQDAKPPSTEADAQLAAARTELETLAQAQALRGQAPATETSDALLAGLQQLQASGDYSREDIEKLLDSHGALGHLD